MNKDLFFKTLKVAYVLFLLSIVLFIHEYSHMVELRKRGIVVRKISLGFGSDFLPHPEIDFSGYPGTRLAFTPILLGAENHLTSEQFVSITKMSYPDLAVSYGAGVWANALTGFVGFIFLIIYRDPKRMFVFLLICIFGSLALIFLKDSFLKYGLVPVGTILLVAATVHAIVTKLRGLKRNILTGPIGVISGLTTKKISIELTAVIISGTSLGLAILNAAPIYPLDGGKIASKLIDQYWSTIASVHFEAAGIPIFAIILFLAFASDLKQLLNKPKSL